MGFANDVIIFPFSIALGSSYTHPSLPCKAQHSTMRHRFRNSFDPFCTALKIVVECVDF